MCLSYSFSAAARNADGSFPKYTVESLEAQFNCGISHMHLNLEHYSLRAPFPNINLLCPSLRVDRFRLSLDVIMTLRARSNILFFVNILSRSETQTQTRNASVFGLKKQRTPSSKFFDVKLL
jgi:hypothetical protein